MVPIMEMTATSRAFWARANSPTWSGAVSYRSATKNIQRSQSIILIRIIRKLSMILWVVKQNSLTRVLSSSAQSKKTRTSISTNSSWTTWPSMGWKNTPSRLAELDWHAWIEHHKWRSSWSGQQMKTRRLKYSWPRSCIDQPISSSKGLSTSSLSCQ